MSTWVAWLSQGVTIPVAWLNGRFGWWSRMDCPIGLRHGIYGETIAFLFPGPRSKTGLRRRGKKSEKDVVSTYIDQVMTGFSGYIAMDELYDGPFCILSIVDNQTYRRLIYEVLDHHPTHQDIKRFLIRFRRILAERHLELQGVTTDGSPLYPEPLAEVFEGVGHQVCEFHMIKEINREVLKAITQARREIKKKMPKLKRGRPSSKADRRAAHRKKKLQNKMTDLFDHRYLFVKHTLTPAEKKTLQRITRGLPSLRHLRSMMDQVYRLFDRRCRTETALNKLAKLRHRVRRFKNLVQILKKLFTPNIEKAWTFLDDSLLPSTSNAVERGYRRYRKMQKSIYRVRTQEHINQRIALDMQREQQIRGRSQTITTLHNERNKAA